ncbi:DUF3667 domain-containing protein [Flavobacterium sp.]|uniref:DUF3667 domain-containing protein n=1 Tax=Flavobacterium sp. TaxID=239 RepID=UPI0026136538|nr:DUF3667 domain-containing protein [Flavobacterium sp.]
MQHNNCLNCDTQLSGRFCSGCGQKADTHRITVRHFLLHDLAHGVWHLDKGIPYTLKQVFTRPGNAARDYIYGKRVRFYNIFYLLLIILGFALLAGNDIEGGILGGEDKTLGTDTNGNFLRLIGKYPKVLFLVMLPLFALSSYTIFRRRRYNYPEHLIIAGFLFVAIFCFLLLAVLLDLSTIPEFIFISELIAYVCLLYPVLVYGQVFYKEYTPAGFIWRMVMVYLLLVFLFTTFMVIVYLAVMYGLL